MNTALSTPQTLDIVNDLNISRHSEQNVSLPLKSSATKSAIFGVASLALMFIDSKVQAATIYAPDWANQASLNNQFAGQSQKDNTGMNFTGIQTTVTTSLLSQNNDIQITFGLNADDIGFGLNTSNWNLAIKVWKSESDFLNRTNGINLPINLTDLMYLNGTQAQMITVGNTTTFTTPTNYGISTSGDQNFVLATYLTGQNLIDFRDGLAIGNNIYIGIINESSVNNGTNYTILSNQITNNAVTSFSSLPGQAFPTPGFGAAFDISGIPSVPEPTSTGLFLLGVAAIAGIRRRNDSN